MKSLLLGAALLLAAGAAGTEDPESLVETATDEAIGYLDDDVLSESEADSLLDYVDVDAVSRFALGQYVHRIDEAGYANYRSAMDAHLREALQSHLGQLAGGSVTILRTLEQAEDEVIVETEVDTGEERLDVNWRLRRDAGSWKVIDVQARDLWLAIEQRAQFAAELDQSGGDIDALVASLNK